MRAGKSCGFESREAAWEQVVTCRLHLTSTVPAHHSLQGTYHLIKLPRGTVHCLTDGLKWRSNYCTCKKKKRNKCMFWDVLVLVGNFFRFLKSWFWRIQRGPFNQESRSQQVGFGLLTQLRKVLWGVTESHTLCLGCDRPGRIFDTNKLLYINALRMIDFEHHKVIVDGLVENTWCE